MWVRIPLGVLTVPSFNGLGQLPSKQFIAVRICLGLQTFGRLPERLLEQFAKLWSRKGPMSSNLILSAFIFIFVFFKGT